MFDLPMRAWNRIHNSLAFRSASAYRLAFSILPAFKRSPYRVDKRFSYLTLAGEKQLPMVRASLWSLLQSTTDLPRVIVAGDKTLSKSSLSRMMKWWPGTLEIWSAEELLGFSRQNLPQHITSLCENHVYGLKAAAIMRASLTGLTLYADTDVLWFRAPQQILPKTQIGNRVSVQLQEDRQMCYDSRLLESWPHLRREPYYCAGVIVSNGDLRETFDQISSLDLKAIFETPGQFTEQTTFAALQEKIGVPALNAEDAYLSWDDQQTLWPGFFDKPWVLRHYVGPVRHLFWRDVFFLYWRRAWMKA